MLYVESFTRFCMTQVFLLCTSQAYNLPTTSAVNTKNVLSYWKATKPRENCRPKQCCALKILCDFWRTQKNHAKWVETIKFSRLIVIVIIYQQIENSNIANQIHGFTIDYGKFILSSYLPSRRSVWENLDRGRKYRPNAVRSVHTTEVKILPYRPT